MSSIEGAIVWGSWQLPDIGCRWWRDMLFRPSFRNQSFIFTLESIWLISSRADGPNWCSICISLFSIHHSKFNLRTKRRRSTNSSTSINKSWETFDIECRGHLATHWVPVASSNNIRLVTLSYKSASSEVTSSPRYGLEFLTVMEAVTSYSWPKWSLSEKL